MAGKKWTEEQKQAARERRAAVKDIHVPSPAGVDEPEVEETKYVDIHINLAPNAEVLTVNGNQYWHGRSYKVEPALARDLNAMMGKTWEHEAQIHGASENQFRRPTHRRLRQG